MITENILNEITKKLSIITYYVRFKTHANLNDINIILENCFKNILNIVFDYNLINLNSEYSYPAIDLGDDNKKVAFQITSTNDISKIRGTLEKFNKYKLYEKYDNLKVLIIGEKKSYKPKFKIDTNYFKLENDVISVFELVKYIKNISIESQKEIINILDKIIGINNIDTLTNIESNEVTTIINIIQMLSNSNDDYELTDDKMPDPNHKINERFKEYKECLNGMFIDLSTIYANSYNKVISSLNIGTIQTKKIGAFLKKESVRRLIKFDNDIIAAYEDMVNMIEVRLKKSTNVGYDKNAIEYFIIKNIVDCNVFPNS